MRIFMTGATGFVGRATVLRLKRSGHDIVAWVRNPEKAKGILGSEAILLPTHCDAPTLAQNLAACDAIINLAGAPVAGKRWTQAYKQSLIASRVDLTQRIIDALKTLPNKPEILISASAVGFYGNQADTLLDEKAKQGKGFLATLCNDWESTALQAQEYGVRTTLLRIGVVLGHGAGALTKMLPFFRMGLGGPIGNGKQYLPWIHLHDLVEAICFTLTQKDACGIYNVVAPESCTSREFGKALGATLFRPAVVPVPSFALKVLLGEAASIVLNSQRVIPQRLQDEGYNFAYPNLQSALQDILIDSQTEIGLFTGKSQQPCSPESSYLQSRRPRYLLETRIVLDAPIEEVFSFFAHPQNLGAMTPPDLNFNLVQDVSNIESGTIINFAIHLGVLPLRWQTEIAQWLPGKRFVDSQTKGPYSSWWHEHHFLKDGNRTIMEDRVYYTPPFGWLGQMINKLFIADKLRYIFKFRYSAMKMRFGVLAPSL